MPAQLFSYFRSSASWRVRIALNLTNSEASIVPVNLLKQEQFNPRNPNNSVPFYTNESLEIGQSVAIMEYLNDLHGNLLPKDIIQRAQVRDIVGLVCCDIHPIQNLRVLKKVGEEAKLEWAQHWIIRGFEALEKVLVKTSGTYSVADSVSMADCVVVPQVANAVRFKVDLSNYPTIMKVNGNCMKLDAFINSAPDKQIDFVN